MVDGVDFMDCVDAEKTHLWGRVHSVHNVHSVHYLHKSNWLQLPNSGFNGLLWARRTTGRNLAWI